MTAPVIDFSDADATEVLDSVPHLDDIENPCEKCGRETGWSGRGRRKKLCDDCKPTRKPVSGVRVTGKSSELAAQAAKTLSGINMLFATGFGALGFFRTMGIAMERNEDFEKAAYAALVTDPKLAQQILSVGQKSGTVMLGLAYGSYGMGIAPVLMQEYKEKKAARIAEMTDL